MSIRAFIFLDVDKLPIQLVLQKYPEHIGKPIVVTNRQKIICVSDEAQAIGITRSLTLEQAKSICPELVKFEPEFSEEEDPRKRPRLARYGIQDVIKEYLVKTLNLTEDKYEFAIDDETYIDVTAPCIQRANKFYPDQISITPSPDILFEDMYGSTPYKSVVYNNNHYFIQILYHAGLIAHGLCRTLAKDPRTNFKFSGGVSTNKLLAKLACGLQRPNTITVLLPNGLHRVSPHIRIVDLPGLKSGRGELIMNGLNISNMMELQAVPYDDLFQVTKSTAMTQKIKDLSFGIDYSKINPSRVNIEITSRRNFQADGSPAKSWEEVAGVIKILAKHMVVRIKEEKERLNRTPVHMKLGIKPVGPVDLKIDYNLGSECLTWEEIYNAALKALPRLFQEEKKSKINEIYLTVKRFSSIC